MSNNALTCGFEIIRDVATTRNVVRFFSLLEQTIFLSVEILLQFFL